MSNENINFEELENDYNNAKSGELTETGGSFQNVGEYKGRAIVKDCETGTSTGAAKVKQLILKCEFLEGEFAGIEFDARVNVEATGEKAAKAVMYNLRKLIALCGWARFAVDIEKIKKNAQRAFFNSISEGVEELGETYFVMVIDRTKVTKNGQNFTNHAFEAVDESERFVEKSLAAKVTPTAAPVQSEAAGEGNGDDGYDAF